MLIFKTSQRALYTLMFFFFGLLMTVTSNSGGMGFLLIPQTTAPTSFLEKAAAHENNGKPYIYKDPKLSGGLSLCLTALLTIGCCTRRWNTMSSSVRSVTSVGSARICFSTISKEGKLLPVSFTGARILTPCSRSVLCRAVENPYDVIGVARDADKSETRKAFRKLALTEHPDVNPDDPEATQRFQRLVEAYNSIMGDVLLPDELLEIRVQATKAYQEKIRKEMDGVSGLAYMGNARLIQGIATVAFFGVLFVLGNLPPDAINSILLPPQARY